MDFLDIHDGLMVAMDKIAAIEAVDEFSSAVHVHFGSETRVFPKNIPYPVLRDIILARNRAEIPQPTEQEQSIARSLTQLAKYQQNFAG